MSKTKKGTRKYMTKTISLAHGNGGHENNELIRDVFYKRGELLSRIC